MQGADGSVNIVVEMDDKDAQRELNSLKRKISSLKESLYVKNAMKSALVKEAENLVGVLDEAKAKLASAENELSKMGAGASPEKYFELTDIVNTQKQRVEELQKRWDDVNDQIDKYTAQITKDNLSLDYAKNKAGEYAQQLAESSKNGEELSASMKNVKKEAEKSKTAIGDFGKRLAGLAKSAFIFSLLYTGFRNLQKYIWASIQTNSEAMASFARLKGALITLAQPLISALIPAFITLMNILTAIVTKIAQFISLLTGKSVKASAASAKAMNQQAKALTGAGKAADKASKSMASFDEINQLSSNQSGDSGGGSGGASTGTDVAPNFDFMDDISGRLEKIASAVMLIGAGFALWKLSDALPGILGTIATKVGGIAVAIGGLILLFDGLKDAWENGVDWGNLIEMLGGAAAAAIGLYIAFGSIAAGIALIVAGAALLVIAFNDIVNNGANLQNTLLTIAGIVATGLGFFLLTGSVIPLVIAGILAIIVAVLSLTGNLEEFCKNLKENILGGIIDFITGVFSGDWDKAWEGIKKVFKGIWNSMTIIVESAINFMIDGINWLIQQLNKIHFEIPDWVPGIGGKSFGISIDPVSKVKLPRLAQGAVIPPNREFMAVLGDQKSGTNVETPLATMVQAFRQALSEGGYGGSNEAVLVLDRDVLGKVVYKLNKAESNRIGVNLAGV